MALCLESIHLTEMKKNAAVKVNMAGDERDTAELNMAGTRNEDQLPPAWARKYFDRQTEILEKMNTFLVNKPDPRRRKTNSQCYRCGKYG